MRYTVVWDTGVWAWSLGTIGLLGLVLFGLLRASLFATPMRFGAPGFAAALIIIVMAAVVAFAPRGYVIDGKKLQVRTVMAGFTYDLTQLSELRTAAPEEVFSLGTLRTFGSGGAFGYYGYFSNNRLGTFLAFATDRNRLVVLRFPQRTLVISPHDPQGFLQEATQKISMQVN